MRAWWLCLALGSLTSACQEPPAPSQRWPGPCRAEWIVYESVTLGARRWVLPIEQGQRRVMSWRWDDQGRLLGVRDDQDGDGRPERDSPINPDDPSAERIWGRCHGVCRYDDRGHLLSDSAADGQDVLRYHYDCWERP